jgi:anti-sigma regulatory factor (Ser/Thr protein kinase)
MTATACARLTVPARIESVRHAAAFLVERARAYQVSAASNPLFEVAIVEALNNAVQHNRSAGEGQLRCEIESVDGRVIVRVLDERAGSAPPVPEPSGTLVETAGEWDALPDSGYGFHLIRAMFPVARAVEIDGVHGLELELNRSQ